MARGRETVNHSKPGAPAEAVLCDSVTSFLKSKLKLVWATHPPRDGGTEREGQRERGTERERERERAQPDLYNC